MYNEGLILLHSYGHPSSHPIIELADDYYEDLLGQPYLRCTSHKSCLCTVLNPLRDQQTCPDVAPDTFPEAAGVSVRSLTCQLSGPNIPHHSALLKYLGLQSLRRTSNLAAHSSCRMFATLP